MEKVIEAALREAAKANNWRGYLNVLWAESLQADSMTIIDALSVQHAKQGVK